MSFHSKNNHSILSQISTMQYGTASEIRFEIWVVWTANNQALHLWLAANIFACPDKKTQLGEIKSMWCHDCFFTLTIWAWASDVYCSWQIITGPMSFEMQDANYMKVVVITMISMYRDIKHVKHQCHLHKYYWECKQHKLYEIEADNIAYYKYYYC